MRIGEATSASGVTVKAVRYYADEELLGPVPRLGRYREFQSHHVERLRIIANCRQQGFSVAEIREVIALLPETGCPPPRAMSALVDAKLASLSEQLKELTVQIGRLEETRKYIDRRINAEPV